VLLENIKGLYSNIIPPASHLGEIFAFVNALLDFRFSTTQERGELSDGAVVYQLVLSI